MATPSWCVSCVRRVAQVAVEPRFCRRMASAKMIDLLMTLALGDTPDKKAEHGRPRPDAEWTNNGSGGSGGSGSPSTSGREGSGGGDTAVDGGGKGGVRSNGIGSPRPQRPGRPTKGKRFSGERVKVATPYVGALRYCVVTIVERVGSILNDDGEYERASSPSGMTSMVVSVCNESGGEQHRCCWGCSMVSASTLRCHILYTILPIFVKSYLGASHLAHRKT